MILSPAEALTGRTGGVRKRTAALAGAPLPTILPATSRTPRKPLKQQVKKLLCMSGTEVCRAEFIIVADRLAIVHRNCGTGLAAAKL